jgi:phenylacetate-coenzyme A ligase PaaK-like adenylate-forming protein
LRREQTVDIAGERMATILDRLAVDTFIGTASYATFAAQRFGEALGRPAAGTAMRTIIAGGEPGLGEPTTRARLADEWGASRISEVMGLGDVMPGLWAECPEGGGMHFTGARNVLVELVDPADGRPVPWDTGADGEAVYTRSRARPPRCSASAPATTCTWSPRAAHAGGRRRGSAASAAPTTC